MVSIQKYNLKLIKQSELENVVDNDSLLLLVFVPLGKLTFTSTLLPSSSIPSHSAIALSAAEFSKARKANPRGSPEYLSNGT
jgi:hypothetical protein